MGKNTDITVQFFKRGTVILMPAVKFPGGTTKTKYAVLLEDGGALYKRGRITACLTTSRKFKRIKSWFVIAPASILGKAKSGETTTIDCLNRISLTEQQTKKCKFIGYLPDDIWEEVDEANQFATSYMRMVAPSKKSIF